MLFPKHENVSTACRFTSLRPYVLAPLFPEPLCPCALMSSPLCPASFCQRPYVEFRISAPQSDLTRKGQPNKVQWGEAQERAFLTLQERLLKKPILKLPDH